MSVLLVVKRRWFLSKPRHMHWPVVLPPPNVVWWPSWWPMRGPPVTKLEKNRSNNMCIIKYFTSKTLLFKISMPKPLKQLATWQCLKEQKMEENGKIHHPFKLPNKTSPTQRWFSRIPFEARNSSSFMVEVQKSPQPAAPQITKKRWKKSAENNWVKNLSKGSKKCQTHEKL